MKGRGVNLLWHEDRSVQSRIERMYETNAQFRAGIRSISQAIPEFVKIMMEQAEEQERMMERFTNELLFGHPDGINAKIEIRPDSKHTLVGGETLVNVHPADRCAGEYCCIHNPSDHHMREWNQHFRQDRGIMERLCPHGIGHPDPDDPTEDTVHGCDGCCQEPKDPRS